MSRKIGLFVDISELFNNISRTYNQRRLDYEKYYEFVADLGVIQCAIAYGSQKYNEAEGFRYCLKQIGFETKYKRPKIKPQGTRRVNWNVEIVLDVISKVERFDCLVLGSSDKELTPLVNWARSKGLTVIILACDVGKSLEKAATRVIEIPQSLLGQ
jgi:uncharacterized LabA/DUF88 family protein